MYLYSVSIFEFAFVFVFHTFQDNVVHFELLVKSVYGVANTLMLQPTATLSRARVTLMITLLKLNLYFEHNSKKAYIDIGRIQYRTQNTLVNLGQNCKRIMQPVTSTAVPRTITVCSCFAVGFVLNMMIMMMMMMRRRRRRIQKVIGNNLGNTN